MKKFWRLVMHVGAIGFGLLLSGCADLPQAPAEVSVYQYEYRLGPGDQINVVVWRNPELSGSYSVRPDGRITTPLVEDLAASGKTATELAREIEQRLAKFLQDPVVTVLVGGYTGPANQQIRILGQAAKPQAIPYRERMTLLDVMITVGGLTDFAAGNRATLMRQNPQPESFRVRLHDLVRKGDLSANVELMPGDVLVIPESWF